MQIYYASQKDDTFSEDSKLLAGYAVCSSRSSSKTIPERMVAFMSPEEIGRYRDMLCFPEYALRECTNHVIQYPKIEEMDRFIYGVLNRLSNKETGLVTKELSFFLTPGGLIIVSEPCEIIEKVKQALIMERKEKHMLTILPERALFLLLEKIVASDMALIRDLDETETILEEKILAGEKLDYRLHIFRLRQKTLLMTQYSGLMVDLSDVLEENEITQVNAEVKRMFHLIGARLDRLERSSATLRESVMQLREAYQSQVDNDANQMMKLFAVVSSIFLPLTFITGWYGMNFRHMPELYWKYAYPALFLVVLVVVSGIIFVFKRKKFL